MSRELVIRLVVSATSDGTPKGRRVTIGAHDKATLAWLKAAAPNCLEGEAATNWDRLSAYVGALAKARYFLDPCTEKTLTSIAGDVYTWIKHTYRTDRCSVTVFVPRGGL